MRTETIKSMKTKIDQPNLSFNRFIKRAFDILASALGLLVLSPVFCLISIIIKRDSPGPVFYRGPRLGMGGKEFGILKFRTMREEAASYAGPRITAEDDSRITPFGKWLRDSKINELPQLWNVLIGEMSLVGPRPEDPSLIETWSPETRAEVLSVRPGVTSPASVLFRDEEKMLSSSKLMDTYLGDILPSKLRLDQLYIRHHSFLLDLDVLFWTFLVVVVPSLREHKPPEDTLFWGPISLLFRRYVNWFFIDTLTTLIAFGMAGVIWRLLVAPLDLGLGKAILVSFAYSVLFSSIAAIMGVQKISWSSASVGEAFVLIPPLAVASVAAFVINSWINFLHYDIILDATVLAFVGYILTRYRTRLFNAVLGRWVFMRQDSLLVRERVLIVGAGDTGQFVAWRLTHTHESSNYKVIGFVDDDMYRQGLRLNGFTVLGKRKDIADLVQKHDIGVIIFAIHNISASERMAILKTCRNTNAQVVTWPDTVGLIRAQLSKTNVASAEKPQPPQYPKGRLMTQWLDVLEADLSQGDFAQVMEDITAMRTALQDTTPKGRRME
ncbi:MAG: sugar transferase [Chloroflexi bacterium]|nr:sugar transferase [Chloroflexota bacterium]